MRPKSTDSGRKGHRNPSSDGGINVSSLEELNARLSEWIQAEYQAREHSSTGMTPQERFQEGVDQLRQLELGHQALEKLFHTRIHRTVRKNGTIRLDSQPYEVDLSLRGQRIELRYDPFKPGPNIEIYHQGHFVGRAHPVDLHVNSQTDRQNYDDHRKS
ncbi:MAG: Mu transposase C-terminal domain-containing protein [Verrucomicrobiota bacterium]